MNIDWPVWFFQGGGWSDPFEVVSGAGVPDPPKAPHVACKSAYSALVSWEPPVNNGATITDYRLEWQQKTEVTDFAMVGHFSCHQYAAFCIDYLFK